MVHVALELSPSLTQISFDFIQVSGLSFKHNLDAKKKKEVNWGEEEAKSWDHTLRRCETAHCMLASMQ
jgi:hypothetical protein